MKPLEVLIIGCGNIAGGFDATRLVDAPPLTHAGAYVQDARFRISACIDPNRERLAAFLARWNVARGYADVAEIEAGCHFDIISICSPTAFHAEHIEAAIALGPRLIFAEKPFTSSADAGEQLLARCEAAGIGVAVNHIRRWDPDVVILRDELRATVWGEIRSLAIRYTKGVVHNGSHAIDLARFLLDEPLELVTVGAPIYDHWKNDPTLPALLRGSSGIPVQLIPAHAADYALFEMEIVTAEGLIAMEDGGYGWRVRKSIDSPILRGYKVLGEAKLRTGRLAEAMSGAIANLYSSLNEGETLASSGRSALEAQRLCEDMRLAARAAWGR